MAVKVTRADRQITEVQELQNTELSNEDIVLVKLLQRFDMIRTYTISISGKMDALYNDMCESEGNVPLVLFHMKTINQLLSNINEEINEATTTDLKRSEHQ